MSKVSITIENGLYALRSHQKDQRLIDALKTLIPSRQRAWNGEARAWLINPVAIGKCLLAIKSAGYERPDVPPMPTSQAVAATVQRTFTVDYVGRRLLNQSSKSLNFPRRSKSFWPRKEYVIMSFLDPLYVLYPEEKEIFGERWIGPAKYNHLESALIAVYQKDPEDGDGQTVEVYCEACPARFYVAKVLPSVNTADTPKPACEIRTGSGTDSAQLIADIAEAISTGMLGVYPASEDKE